MAREAAFQINLKYCSKEVGDVVVVQSPSVRLCDPMDCSMPGLPVPRHLPEFAQVRVHCISDALQPSHPLTTSFLSALNNSQYQ